MTAPASPAPRTQDVAAAPSAAPDEAAVRATRWRRTLRWILGIAIVLVALVGAAFWNANRVADATLAEHRARFEEEQKTLAAKPRGRPALLEPAMPGDANAVMEAFLAAVSAVPAAERERLTPNNPDATSNPSLPDEEDRILAAHPAPIAAVTPLLRVPQSTRLPRLGDADRDVSARIPRFHEGARWITAAALRAIARGERDAALRDAALLATIGFDFEREGLPIERLVGIAVASVGLAHTRDALAAGPVDAKEARTLARVLERLEALRPSLAEMHAVDRADVRGMLVSGSLDSHGVGEEATTPGWRELWSMKVLRASRLREWDGAAERASAAFATADADRPGAIRAVRALADSESDASSRRGLELWRIVLNRDANVLARLRVARASLAVAAYAAEKHTRPSSLFDLVPEYLADVPTDPWGSGPLYYAGRPDRKVWSVGPDGRDDGGAPLADPDDNNGPGDIVWKIGQDK